MRKTCNNRVALYVWLSIFIHVDLLTFRCYFVLALKQVKVGNGQEMAQSERNSHYKNLYIKKTQRKPSEQLLLNYDNHHDESKSRTTNSGPSQLK